MKNITLSINKYIFIILLLLVVSCGENSALKEDYYYVDKSNKDWLINDTLGDNFIMIDENGISQSFSMNDFQYSFNPSSTTILGVTTRTSYREEDYQSFSSNFGQLFSILLSASYAPFGDELYIKLGNTSFAYDFAFNTISRIECDNNYKSKTITDTGYTDSNQRIKSTVEFFDNYVVNNYNYQNVLHFSLKDFILEWNDFTVTDIYIAKKVGLIKYVLSNELEYYRN